jgi:hypothetical protein
LSFHCPHLNKEGYVIEKRRQKILENILLTACCLVITVFTISAARSTVLPVDQNFKEIVEIPSDIPSGSQDEIINSTVVENNAEKAAEEIKIEERADVIDDARTNTHNVAARGASSSTPDAAKSIINEVAVSMGCTQREIDLLLKIAFKESSYRCNAVSPNGDCVGYFQLDSDKGTLAQRLDPYWNTEKAISYMRDRYGSIEKAYLFRVAHNWY